MTIGSIFLGLALLVLVGLFVARPLLTSEGQRKGRFTAREGLQAQKEEILSYIKALDFDFETGKLPEEDYQQQRDHYLTEGSAVLKKLDQLDQLAAARTGEAADASAVAGTEVAPPSGRAAQTDRGVDDFEAALEAAVARRRKRATGATKREAAAPIKKARVVTPVTNGRTRFCSQCGKPTDPEDKFCAHCGHSLKHPQPAT